MRGGTDIAHQRAASQSVRETLPAARPQREVQAANQDPRQHQRALLEPDLRLLRLPAPGPQDARAGSDRVGLCALRSQ